MIQFSFAMTLLLRLYLVDLVRIGTNRLRSELALIVVRVPRIETVVIIEAMIYASVRHMVDIVGGKLAVFVRGKWVGGW